MISNPAVVNKNDEYKHFRGIRAGGKPDGFLRRASRISIFAAQCPYRPPSSVCPVQKGICNMKEASLDAEAFRVYREREESVRTLKTDPSEENLWAAVAAFRGYPFHTFSGLLFHYSLKTGRDGGWTKELWIDRRENSKSLSWSSFMMAYKNALSMRGQVIPGPKSLGNIRGVTYIYPILWRFGLIAVPEETEENLRGK